jgi:hypothetical protein
VTRSIKKNLKRAALRTRRKRMRRMSTGGRKRMGHRMSMKRRESIMILSRLRGYPWERNYSHNSLFSEVMKAWLRLLPYRRGWRSRRRRG